VPVRLTVHFTITTPAIGSQLLVAVTNDPSAAGDWTNWAANYAEYRVLSSVAHYVPARHNWVDATVGTSYCIPCPLYAYALRVGSYTPTYTASAFWQTQGCKCVNLDTPFMLALAASGATEMAYLNTGSPVPTLTFAFFANSVNNSTYYADINLEMVVQFRNRN
jgi:hypothetical protein